MTTPKKGQLWERKNSSAQILIGYVDNVSNTCMVKGMNSGELWAMTFKELHERYTPWDAMKFFTIPKQ